MKDIHLIDHGRVARCAFVSALLVSATLGPPALAADTGSGGEAHLVDAGAKPLRAWRPAAPRPQELRLQLQLAEGDSLRAPPVVIRLTAEPNGAGWILEGTELRMLFPEGIDLPEAEINRVFHCGTQIRGTLTISDGGIAIQLELPEDATDDVHQAKVRPAVRDMLQVFAQLLPTVGAILPAQPIGAGARWDTHKTVRKDVAGQSLTLTSEQQHRLTHADDHTATTTFSGSATWRVRGQPLELHGPILGEAQLDDRVPLPLRIVLHSTLDSTAGAVSRRVRIDATLEAMTPRAP